MRTTLKRGMGRAATLNGNGRAVLPPAVLDPMRRYRQPEPPRRSLGRTLVRVFGWILLAVLVVPSRIGGGPYLYRPQTPRAHRAPTKPADQLPDHGQLPRVQAAREQAARRVRHGRPPLHQHGQRSGRLREDRPPSRLPEARRAEGTRLRPLPAHGLRPLPPRAA